MKLLNNSVCCLTQIYTLSADLINNLESVSANLTTIGRVFPLEKAPNPMGSIDTHMNTGILNLKHIFTEEVNLFYAFWVKAPRSADWLLCVALLVAPAGKGSVPSAPSGMVSAASC